MTAASDLLRNHILGKEINMKEIYEKPEIETIVFDAEDVIITSGKPIITVPDDENIDDEDGD